MGYELGVNHFSCNFVGSLNFTHRNKKRLKSVIFIERQKKHVQKLLLLYKHFTQQIFIRF